MSTLLSKQIQRCEQNAKETAQAIEKAAQDVVSTQGLDSAYLDQLKTLVDKAISINQQHNSLVE